MAEAIVSAMEDDTSLGNRLLAYFSTKTGEADD
jgi:hypothetical protein